MLQRLFFYSLCGYPLSGRVPCTYLGDDNRYSLNTYFPNFFIQHADTPYAHKEPRGLSVGVAWYHFFLMRQYWPLPIALILEGFLLSIPKVAILEWKSQCQYFQYQYWNQGKKYQYQPIPSGRLSNLHIRTGGLKKRNHRICTNNFYCTFNVLSIHSGMRQLAEKKIQCVICKAKAMHLLYSIKGFLNQSVFL